MRKSLNNALLFRTEQCSLEFRSVRKFVYQPDQWDLDICWTADWLIDWLTIRKALLIYSMEQSPWETNRSSASQKIPAFYGTWRSITAFTSARHLSLSWASSIQSIPSYPTSWKSILILASHLRLGLPSGLFPSGFPTKTLYMPFLSPTHATCLTHLILLDLITRIMLVSSTDH